MIYLSQVGYALMVAIAGAIASFAIQKTLRWVENKRLLRRNLRGTWTSWWLTGTDSEGYPSEITERVKISVSWWHGTIKISNEKREEPESTYRAFGAFRGSHMIGDYRSKEGSKGVFMFSVSPDHSFLYGFWMGESFDQRNSFEPIVIATSEPTLTNGKTRIAKAVERLRTEHPSPAPPPSPSEADREAPPESD